MSKLPPVTLDDLALVGFSKVQRRRALRLAELVKQGKGTTEKAVTLAQQILNP